MSPKGYRSAYEQQWVGIDVCQKYLDVYVRPLGNLFQVTYNEVGISKLVQTLKNIEPKLIVLEGSAYAQSAARRLRSESFCGGMEIDAVIKLTEAKLSVAVINPRQARDFAKATVLARSLAPVGGAGSLVKLVT